MRILIFIGLLIFLWSLVMMSSNNEQLDVDRNGKVVKMRIEHLPPSCIGSRVRYFVTYSYQGKLFEKATRGNFCEIHFVGEMIDMKYLAGSTIILRDNESAIANILSFGAIGIFGLMISLLQWRKWQKQTRIKKPR